jgi:competence/damage-inducible protein CinA-like protein
MTHRVLRRAGIVITGTEVLTGAVQDRNGPWLSEQLAALGVEPAHILVVGDRPRDIAAALRFMAQERVDLIVTSGGLGPTADDLTAQVVGEFQGREMTLDEPLRGRIAEILKPLAERHPHLDRDAIEEGNRKQATIPAGSTVLEPVGTAPGLLVAPVDAVSEHPPIVVLPGPPRELQPMWERALRDGSLHAAVPRGQVARVRTLRLFGIPESEIALTLREAHRAGVEMSQLEVTTCLRGGEIEVVTRFEPAAQPVYEAFEGIVAGRHADTLYSRDGSTVDEQLAVLLNGSTRRTVAVAESCTGGLLLGRLTSRPGASAYVVGGVVAYSNEVKIAEAGVPRETIERHGAVSEQVARALADGVRERMDADVGVGVTGIAGPGGGSEEKPVGLVWVSVSDSGGSSLTRSVRLPGNRADVRDRAVTVAMHMLRRTLSG